MSATATDDRFWSKVEGDDPLGCWLWTGTAPSGYGKFTTSTGVSVYAKNLQPSRSPSAEGKYSSTIGMLNANATLTF